MQAQQQQTQSINLEGDGHLEEGQTDQEIMTLSTNSKPPNRAEKIEQYAVYEQRKYCLCFNTRCEFLLFVLIAVLVVTAGYLIYDNRVQEGEISQILTILRKNEDQKQRPPDPPQIIPAISIDLNTQSKDDSSVTAQNNIVKVDPNSIPKKLWYYNQVQLLESKKWTQLTFKRIKKHALEGGFEITLVNEASWQSFVPKRKQRKLEDLINHLSESKKELTSKQIDNIIKEVTILQVLRENGGVFIDQDIILTQNLDWLAQINSNDHVNAWKLVLDRQFNLSPHVIGFYSPQLSSESQKYPRINSKEEAQSYMVRLPSLNFYFLAVTPSSSFIEDVLEEYYSIVKNLASLPSLLKKMHIEIDFNRNGNLAEYLFQIACQFALRKKQLQLQVDQIAIQHYLIACLNENYGPAKLRSYLGETQIDKIFNHLSFMTQEELEYEFGTIRYLAVLTPMDKISSQFQRMIQGRLVIKRSFIHQFLLNGQDTDGVIEVHQQALTERIWDELPNNLWLFLQEPPHSSSFFLQLWMKHLEKVANQSNFNLTIVTNDNLHDYLPKETIDSISKALVSNKLTIYDTTNKQLLSLALLYEHGGVWVEPCAFFTEGLGWLKQIAKQKFIWNRFGEVPKAVVAFHPHFGSPFHWNYDPSTGAKEAWHLAYEHSLIAASPKSQLIKDWLTELQTNLQLNYDQVVKKFDHCKINDHKWINEKNHQLLSQDTIKCLLGSKTLDLIQKDENKSAPNYYGLWGLNGFAGLLKMRQYTNFISGRSMQNPLIWRYSLEQTQDLIGKINYFTKLYDPAITKIQDLLTVGFHAPLREFHSHSFIMRLIEQSEDKIIKQEGKIHLESYLHDFEKAKKQMEESEKTFQSLSNMPRILWVYQGGEFDPNEFFTTLVLKNINHFAQASQFDVRLVTDQNYKAWLSSDSETYKKLSFFLSQLDYKLSNEQSNLKDHYQRIKSEIILLSLVYEFGGIYITKRIILHENFDWLGSVETLEFINRGTNSTAQVFGIFSPGYSSLPTNQIGDNHVESPSLQNFFLATGKKTQFIKDFIEEYIKVIMENTKAKERLKNVNYNFNWLHGDDPYYECFFLASQFTLFNRREALKKQNVHMSPLDFYGLYAINTHYYPYKLYRYYSFFKAPPANIIKSLGNTYFTELEEEVGKLRFFSIISKQTEISKFMQNITNQEEANHVLEESFLHKFLMFGESSGIVKQDFNYSTAKSGVVWSSLPKEAWVYVPEQVNQSSFGVKLFFLALKDALSQAGFQLKEINDKNIEQYIDKFNLKKINKLVNKNNEHKSLLYMLAVLFKHGGISLPLQSLFTEDLSWIRGIADLDKKLMFNTYGETPKILMMVDTLRSPANKWIYNSERQQRTGHNIGWSQSFIAVEKENDLIKEWYEEYTTYLQLDSKELSEVFEQCKIRDFQWSSSDSSKLGTDALLCVLNRKQNELKSQGSNTQVCDYYKLWGISEFLGLRKMEDGLNLDETVADLNPFIWRWERPMVQQLIGGIRPMVKLTRKQISQIENIIWSYKLNAWGAQNSLLVKNLYDRVKGKLKEADGKIFISQ